MSIADKIRKIIAKADSSTHPEEAYVFLSKAQRMMEEHGMSLLDLGRLDSDDPVGVDKYFAESPKTLSWRNTLAMEAATFFGCKLVVTTFRDGRGKVEKIMHSTVGRESARITYQLMWPFILRQVMQMACEDFRRGLYKHQPQAYRDIGLALAVRLSDLNRAKARQDRADAKPLAGVNALVPVDLIELAKQEAFPNAKSVKGKEVNLKEQAMIRANQVSLYTQTGAGKSALKIGAA